MLETRWYLQRLETHPGRPIALVVEEVGAERRGVLSVIQSRPHGREILPWLRMALQERLDRGEGLAVPSRFFDPVEDDGPA